MEHLENLIVGLKESLERELAGLRQEMHEGFAQVNARFDTQAARLERHAGLWQTGARWSSRMNSWAEKVDGALEAQGPRDPNSRAAFEKVPSRLHRISFPSWT